MITSHSQQPRVERPLGSQYNLTMPHLLVFAPSQKAIIDTLDNSMSLIGIMHGFTVHRQEDTPEEAMPPNAVIPMKWAVGTVWLRSPDDGEKTFEQRLEIISPNNTRFETDIVQPFKMTHRTHHIAMSTNSFPVGVPGEYKVVISLREVGGEWKMVAEYPIEVLHDLKKEA